MIFKTYWSKIFFSCTFFFFSSALVEVAVEGPASAFDASSVAEAADFLARLAGEGRVASWSSSCGVAYQLVSKHRNPRQAHLYDPSFHRFHHLRVLILYQQDQSTASSTHLWTHRRVRTYCLQIDFLWKKAWVYWYHWREQNDITATNQSDWAFLGVVITGLHSVEGVDEGRLLKRLHGRHDDNKRRNKKERIWWQSRLY